VSIEKSYLTAAGAQFLLAHFARTSGDDTTRRRGAEKDTAKKSRG